MPNCTQTNKPSERQIFLLPILSIMLMNIIATKKIKHTLQTHICSNQQQNLHLICDLQPHWHRPAQDFLNKNRSRLPLFFVARLFIFLFVLIMQLSHFTLLATAAISQHSQHNSQQSDIRRHSWLAA